MGDADDPRDYAVTDSRPTRWREPFGQTMDEGVVDRLLAVKPFSRFEESAFPANLPLRGILLNDTRIRRYRKGEFVVREGDYGNSAFLVLKGQVRLILDRLPQDVLGRGAREKKGIWRTIAQVLRHSPYPESRPFSGRRNIGQEASKAIFLQDVPRVLHGKRSAILREGEFFGEIAALGRTPRVATIIAEEDGLELLEIRWQGLRDIGRFAPEWYQHIDDNYRKYGLNSHLRATSPINRLDASFQLMIAEQTRFLRFGGFDWQHDFKQHLRVAEHSERLQSEPVVIREGDYLNGLYLVRAGFVRVSRRFNNSEKTIAYLGKGQSFGLKEMLYNSRHESPIGAQYTLRALGYVDLLLIPSHLVEDYVLPALTDDEKKELSEGVGEDEKQELLSRDDMPSEISPQLVEFFMDQRTINGTATMLINLDRCTRCDDCVRACASTHDNNPRFIRHGPVSDGIQVTNACMHCMDPVCMLECPTGAIHRDETEGQILINDYTCIGCAMCANSCPYDNIQMVPITDEEGRPQYPVKLDADGNIVAQKTWEEPFRKAAKCDLCSGQSGGPACARACPHDALIRSDMRDLPALAGWLNR